jgi:glycosyltransferase involved in cell wall biosynthesis
MKVAFVSRYFPVHPEKYVHGVYKRMGMFVEAMKEACELEMLFYVDPRLDLSAEYRATMEERLSKHWDARVSLDLCKLAAFKSAQDRWGHYVRPALSIHNYSPYSQTLEMEQIGALRNLLSRNPDILFVHRLDSMVSFVLSKLQHPRVYFDLDDIEHIAFARSIRLPPWWWSKWLYYLRVPILALWEHRAIRRSRATFVCSERDKRYLHRIGHHKNVMVIPNAVESHKQQEAPSRSTLMFIGVFDYLPNAVAADFLISKIWPKILSDLPNARLLIAGAHPENVRSYSETPHGVEFLGFVENLEELYRKVGVVCCPILAGGGTRIKILEAAAYGKPVVSTVVGAEGLELSDGHEILLRNDPESFANACVQLLTDRELALKIGAAARSVVMDRYEKSAIVGKIRRELGLCSYQTEMAQQTDLPRPAVNPRL